MPRASPPGSPGLYLHVPFCSAICPYCDFSVLKAGLPARKRFVEHCVAEVPLAALEWKDPRPFDTVYFGGGTPSLLSPEDLARVLAACRCHLAFATPWIFLEANPEDVTADACAAWRRSRRANAVARRAGLLRRRAALPRPPPHRRAGAGRGRDRAGGRLRHRLGRPHLRPARTDAGGLAARACRGGRARARPRLLLPAHHPRAHALRRRREAGPAHRDARGRAGRSLRAHAPLPGGRRLRRVRGLQLRAQPRSRVPPQPQVLGPHALPRARPLGALAGHRRFRRGSGRRRSCARGLDSTRHSAGRPPLVERAANPALGEPCRGRRAAGRGRGVPRREGACDRGSDARPAHHGRHRPRRLHGAIRVRPAEHERGARRAPRRRGSPGRAGGRGAGPAAGSDCVRAGRRRRHGRRVRHPGAARGTASGAAGASTVRSARAPSRSACRGRSRRRP